VALPIKGWSMNPLKDVVQECLRKSETAIEIKDVMTSNSQIANSI
jgi:hypothetical protein